MLSVRVGAARVHVVSDGRFRLDGGAMFGVVPKPLWERHLPADDRNRVTLGLNCLLVETAAGRRVLVDTGLGTRWSQPEMERLGVERPEGTVVDALARLGLAPEAIDVVVLTHLHFDHAGGAVTATAGGRLVPTFPRAEHVIQEREWNAARAPDERSRASYRRHDREPLEDAGLVRLVHGTETVADGVSVDLMAGHCPGMQVVRVESEGQGLLFPGDLLPTTAHLRPAWIMAFDVDVAATVRARRRILERLLQPTWIACLDHEPETPLVRVVERPGRDGRREATAIPLEEVEANP